MADGTNEVRYPDIMKAIHDFVEEPTDDVTRIPLHRIKAELEAEGIDVTPHVQALKARLAKLRAAQELEQAGQRHAQISQKLQSKRPLERVNEMGQRLLDGIVGGPRPALGYFRNLTDAGDDTKQAFAEDVELLDQLEADDDLEHGERT